MKTKRRLEVTRFNNENDNNEIKYDKFYNFLPKTTLENSVGISIATLPYSYDDDTTYNLALPDDATKFEGLSLFRQHFTGVENDVYRLLVYTNNKKIYINQMLRYSTELHWLYEMTFEKNPITLAYKKQDNDAIIISDGSTMKIWETNYSPYTVHNTPIITDMCMNEGVLFCCLKEPACKIWYATDLNPEKVGDISSYSDYISLNDNLGNANRVLTFDENVYVIRDHGISKISNIQKKFIVSEVYSCNTKIFKDTACVCGNLLLFMTADGLYTFNGAKISKHEINFAKYLNNNSNLYASSLGNKYYLSCKLDYNDDSFVGCENAEYVNNSLVVFNVDDYSYEIVRGVDIKQLLPVKTDTFEKMLVVFNNENSDKIGEIVENSVYFEQNLPSFWISKQIFASFETKMFTKLVVDSDENVKFKLIYDNQELVFTTYTSGLNEFVFKIFGKQLKLEISSQKPNVVINKVYLDYYDY